jgi:predicted permease
MTGANVIQDLRYAMRQLRRSPGFALTAMLTLALGIGALTTVATWTNAVLYSPWPHVAAPRQFRFISATVLGGGGYSVHYDAYQFVGAQGRSFQDAAAFDLTTVDLAAPGTQPEAIAAGVVSSSYFPLLGLQPQAGRFFQRGASDRAYGSNDEVVLSDRYWREHFNADKSLIGRTISINRHAFTVIGIAPAEFYGIFGGIAESAWLPLSSLRDLSADAPQDPLDHYGLQVVVRLRPGVTDASAEAELSTLARSFALQQPGGKLTGWTLNLGDSAHFERGFFIVIGAQLPVLFGASIMLMVLVCINIASLLGQQAARRRREVAIRTALGATPSRIASQVFAETALLAIAGALGGWAASVLLSRALYALLPDLGFSLAFNLHTDARILGFVALIGVAVTLVCGMYPTRQSFRVSQREAMQAGGAAVVGATRKRIGQRILLGLQLGICFVVLVCSGLLIRTSLNIFNRDTGFNRANVMTAAIDLSRSGYSVERAQAFRTALLERLRTAPGISGVTVTSHLPMGDAGSGNTQGLSVPGYVPAKGEEMSVITDFEGPDFFRTMEIGVDRGRDFSASDNLKAPRIAIVNESMARRYWPKEDAIGRSVEVGHQQWLVVGIVHDYTYHMPDNTEATPLLFLPLAQWNTPTYTSVAVRSRTSADLAAGQLRQAVAALDPSLPLENMSTLEKVSNQLYQFFRIPAELLGVYTVSSLLVAMLGLYAVMAYSVIERYREFALRITLGSTRAQIFGLILGGSASVAALGLAVGTLGSIAAVRLLRSALFGVAPFDPLSFGSAASLLFVTALLSGMIPARRAAAIQPMQALRSE